MNEKVKATDKEDMTFLTGQIKNINEMQAVCL